MKNQDCKTADVLRRYASAQGELCVQGNLSEDEVSLIAVKISNTGLSAQAKVDAIEGLLKVGQFYSRRCRVTGKGFNEGFILFGDTYVKDESNAVSVLRDYYLSAGDVAVGSCYKDSAVLEYAYNQEESLFTEWDLYDEIAEENFFIELNCSGKLISWDEYITAFAD